MATLAGQIRMKPPEPPNHSFKVDDIVVYHSNGEKHLPMTEDKEYKVIDIDSKGVFVNGDNNEMYYYAPIHFTLSTTIKLTLDTVSVGQVVKITGATYSLGDYARLGDLATIIKVDRKNGVLFLDIGGGHDFIADVSDVISGRGFGIEATNAVDVTRHNKARVVVEHITNIMTNCRDLYQIECIAVADKIQELRHDIAVKTEDFNKLDALRISNFTKFVSPSAQANMRNHLISLLANCYDDIEVRGLNIKALTKPITIKYKDTKVTDHSGIFELGRYYIHINNLFQIQISNELESYVKTGEQGLYMHPHIKGNIPCWGTYEGEIVTQTANYRITELLQSIHKYLSHCVRIGWYKPIYMWSPDWDARCHTCYALADNCHCKPSENATCPGCGEQIDDCTCLYCPISGDRLGDDYDDYCMTECSRWHWADPENPDEGGECRG